MDQELCRELEALRCAPISKLREKYRELFGEEPRSKHRECLFRKVAWRMQAVAEGGLSERAKHRALEIANDADLRILAPRSIKHAKQETFELRSLHYDPRIPPPGTVLKRDYNGATITVKISADGFEHEDKLYSSLSAIATQVTGTRWNGLAFFGLTNASRRRERRDGR